MKNLRFYGALFTLAFLAGLIISSAAPANVSADVAPQPDICNCYDSYQCGAPSSMCNNNPAYIARLGIHECAIECGWEEIGCCVGQI